ncbi:hypothetical protein FHX59_004597 [Paraburkholderia silvatlantica]|uniref:Uncharacterized protein n=2 Tax=Paraburkholderia silvatlantica TaxID=321895 RepID=A0ABR6FU73_9BURK|nr:hypothetical protein [Paraburkholderia silvatlantica]MBB2930149.1 hypothetical protein [Paraburkholderia silvatlantica]
MRDYVLEHLGIEKIDQQQFHEQWSKVPSLAAARDIANSTKHFQLREPPPTKAVRRHKSKFIEIYANGRGEVKFAEVEGPDITVHLSDGAAMPLHEFTREIMSYWRAYLAQHGIKVRRQSVTQLIGDAAK